MLLIIFVILFFLWWKTLKTLMWIIRRSVAVRSKNTGTCLTLSCACSSDSVVDWLIEKFPQCTVHQSINQSMNSFTTEKCMSLHFISYPSRGRWIGIVYLRNYVLFCCRKFCTRTWEWRSWISWLCRFDLLILIVAFRLLSKYLIHLVISTAGGRYLHEDGAWKDRTRESRAERV